MEQADPQPNILTIQKLWQKNQKYTIYTIKFYHLMHAEINNTKICFYVNKIIDTNK